MISNLKYLLSIDENFSLKKKLSNLTRPLTPKSDRHETSSYNIHTLSSKQVMRILKLIR